MAVARVKRTRAVMQRAREGVYLLGEEGDFVSGVLFWFEDGGDVVGWEVKRDVEKARRRSEKKKEKKKRTSSRFRASRKL